MSSLENLEQLERQLRALLSERKQLKSRLNQLEADAPAKSRDKDLGEFQRVKDLLTKMTFFPDTGCVRMTGCVVV